MWYYFNKVDIKIDLKGNGHMIKKKLTAQKLFMENQSLFKCPICNEMMLIKDFTLCCYHNHSFDISKKGYLNLLTANNVSIYPKALFLSRKRICKLGLYNPLINEIINIICKSNPVYILDAGCGEGSHLVNLYNKCGLRNKYIGIDISKESIKIATNNLENIMWCVADTSRLPFQSSSFDLILNILAPANYSEFLRVLKNDGMIIKVIPGKLYLQELRAVIYQNEKLKYSNYEVKSLFYQELAVVESICVKYQFTVKEELVHDLVTMTPLSFGKIDLNIFKGDFVVTVDLEILLGKKK